MWCGQLTTDMQQLVTLPKYWLISKAKGWLKRGPNQHFSCFSFSLYTHSIVSYFIVCGDSGAFGNLVRISLALGKWFYSDFVLMLWLFCDFFFSFAAPSAWTASLLCKSDFSSHFTKLLRLKEKKRNREASSMKQHMLNCFEMTLPACWIDSVDF